MDELIGDEGGVSVNAGEADLTLRGAEPTQGGMAQQKLKLKMAQ